MIPSSQILGIENYFSNGKATIDDFRAIPTEFKVHHHAGAAKARCTLLLYRAFYQGTKSLQDNKNKIKNLESQAWWHMPFISAFGRQRQASVRSRPS